MGPNANGTHFYEQPKLRVTPGENQIFLLNKNFYIYIIIKSTIFIHLGWTGPYCNMPTTPTTFKPQSFVKYALSFEPDKFSTNIQLRFRTREQFGELFRISDQHSREYGILEMKNAKLYFRYSLNSVQIEEHEVSLSSVEVDDGQWHIVKIQRYGSASIIELDGGEGAHFNQSISFDGHQWLSVDKQEGVYAGGKPEYSGEKTFDVKADYQKSCIDDIRYFHFHFTNY